MTFSNFSDRLEMVVYQGPGSPVEQPVVLNPMEIADSAPPIQQDM